uniref:Tubulin--tyrosine ligase-like protein 9 n=1 Tax=Strigamia maritima TaxID=126957 RepID=T1J250_STRMM
MALRTAAAKKTPLIAQIRSIPAYLAMQTIKSVKSLRQQKSIQRKLNPPGDKVIKYKCHLCNTVNDVFKARGWQETNDDDWDICWCDSYGFKDMFDACYMDDGRKICHFRNHYELTRKNLIMKNLKRLRKLLEKTRSKTEAEKCDICPVTFELPSEYHIFVEEFRKNPGHTWIMKPAAKSQGKGIFLFQKLKDITDWKKNQLDPEKEMPETYVVQRYVANPYLIGGRKFDLRVYVLVTSYNPLKVWLYREGFARFSTIPFSLDSIENMCKHYHTLTTIIFIEFNLCNTLLDIDIHLTNVAVQKTTVNYDPEKGCKWALLKLRTYLAAKHGEDVVYKIIDDIIEVVIKSLQAVQKIMISDKHCFELYGYDILIDQQMKPWLIEVNASPALTASNQEDYSLKFSMLNDVMEVIDFGSKLVGNEKRVGGFDLIWNDGPVYFSTYCDHCKLNRRPPIRNAFLAASSSKGCLNSRTDVFPPTSTPRRVALRKRDPE